jgi:hypothetical protein
MGMASERANDIERDLHLWHDSPTIATIKNTGGCRCLKCVERRLELIDKALMEERKQSAKECIAIVAEYVGTDEMIDEIAKKFGLGGG